MSRGSSSVCKTEAQAASVEGKRASEGRNCSHRVPTALDFDRWQVLQGDCLELLRSLPDGGVDAVVTDPPYDAKTHAGGMTRNAGAGGGLSEASRIEMGFSPLADLAWLDEAFRVCRGWVLAFCSLEMIGAYAAAAGDRWVRAGVWHKPNSAPQFTGDRPAQGCEGIAIMHAGGKKSWNGGGSRAFWSHPIESGFLSGEPRFHPTQKPVCLMAELCRLFTPPGGLVLDPFTGSGSTGKAAMLEGFRFLGMELDPAYCDIARARIQAAAAQPRLDFDAPEQEQAPKPKQTGLWEETN